MNTETDGAINTLLHPLTVDSFFDTYWEQSPVHIERNDDNYFADLLSIELIDTLISSSELYFPDVQLIRQPDGIPTADYTDSDKRILPLRLVEHYAAGATLTVARADTKIATLGSYCRNLQAEWQMPSHANLYLSPPAHQGFNPHYDSHDVFILQISGKKRFNFYANNVELPFNEDVFDADSFQPGEKTEELTVTAGDTLYIPRGITHDAIALEQSPSLHITIGVYPVTVRDLLLDLIQQAAEQDTRFRRSIPLTESVQSTTNQSAAAATTTAPTTLTTVPTASLLQELIDNTVNAEQIEKTLSIYQHQVAIQSGQDSHGLLTRQYSSPVLTEASVVALRAGMVIGIDHKLIDGATVTTLRCPGHIVEFHEPMGAAVQWLIDHQTATTIGEIPAINTEQKFALIDKLLRQNVISIS